jgi:hypothetical protein
MLTNFRAAWHRLRRGTLRASTGHGPAAAAIDAARDILLDDPFATGYRQRFAT